MPGGISKTFSGLRKIPVEIVGEISKKNPGEFNN